MKAMTKMQYIAVLASAGALLLLAACGPVTRDVARVDGSPDPSAFADALSPAGGVPCRIRRPVYSSLERQQGIRGSVRVTYVVNTAGRIDLAIVDKSSGNQQLDDAAREAVAQSTCAPYVVDGIAHRVIQHTVFNFGTPFVGVPAPRRDAQPAIVSPQAANAAPVGRASPVTAASTSVVGAVSPAPASSSAPPLSLGAAVQAAMLKRIGVAPDSPRAAQLRRWGERMRDDPDVGRFMGNGPNHANVFSLSPSVRAAFFSDAVLRLAPEERSMLVELTLKAFDSAPRDCGGNKSSALVISRYLPLGTMSDAEVDAYFNVTLAMFQKSAQQAPLAEVTEAQRAQASAHVAKSLQAVLNGSADDIRAVAATVVDPAGASAEDWCRNVRIFNRALLATPQPYRDWSIVAADLDAKSRNVALAQAAAASDSAPDYPTRVRRRIRPNIVWSGPLLDLATVIAVRSAPNGTLLSITVRRSSGNAAWDMAAVQAVQRSAPMPPDDSGHVPGEMILTLKPTE
ncbi:TonB family protein [Burkholderia cenocepacia]|uniref:TonB family protein n=1 Tax=Burkholderia cenocepacia TaxID=95486 RepID=UPI001BA47CDD|nr:TonB family protein [Burkholderia cenocepacia]